MKAVHAVCVGIAMFMLVVAAPAALGVSPAEQAQVTRDAAGNISGGAGHHRYVYVGGFYGGK